MQLSRFVQYLVLVLISTNAWSQSRQLVTINFQQVVVSTNEYKTVFAQIRAEFPLFTAAQMADKQLVERTQAALDKRASDLYQPLAKKFSDWLQTYATQHAYTIVEASSVWAAQEPPTDITSEVIQAYNNALQTPEASGAAAGTGNATIGSQGGEAHYCITPFANREEPGASLAPSIKTIRGILAVRNTCAKDVTVYLCAQGSSTKAWACRAQNAHAGGISIFGDTFLCNEVDCSDWGAPIWNAVYSDSGATLNKPDVDTSAQRVAH